MQCSAVVRASVVTLASVLFAGCIAVESSSTPDGGMPTPSDAGVADVDPPNDVTAVEPTVAMAKAPTATACPADMVLIEGTYCPDVRQTCLRWLDEGKFWNFRCAVYAKEPTCASSEKVPMKFCIDRYEYTKPGDKLPEVHHSWTSAGAVCAAQGKRLCFESEWQFACEGPDMHPYPYGDGFHRNATTCNIDRTNLGKPNAGLRDLRSPAGAHPECVSPFGVYDMSGNVEEWTTLDHPTDPKDTSSMKGAWWLPGRNHCRAATTGHGHTYEGGQVGVRCCADLGQ